MIFHESECKKFRQYKEFKPIPVRSTYPKLCSTLQHYIPGQFSKGAKTRVLRGLLINLHIVLLIEYTDFLLRLMLMACKKACLLYCVHLLLERFLDRAIHWGIL